MATIINIKDEPNETLRQLKELFDNRMLALERKMEFLIDKCTTILAHCDLHKKMHASSCCAQLIMPKITEIDTYIRRVKNAQEKNVINSEAVLLVPKKNSKEPQIIELPSEKDLPSGLWLGNEDNPKARVRVDITANKLEEITATCLTPEKMALALLDALFPKEVLAVSNISGKGKHSKKQLDPLLIFAIRCHLIYKFNITDQDWNRIKLNIDSKCRSVWRKNNKRTNLTNCDKQQNSLHDKLLEDTNEVDTSNNYSCSGRSRSRSNSSLESISDMPLILEVEEFDSDDNSVYNYDDNRRRRRKSKKKLRRCNSNSPETYAMKECVTSRRSLDGSLPIELLTSSFISDS